MRRIIRVVIAVILVLIAGIAIYFTTAWVLSRFGVGGEEGGKPEITMYIMTNGVHTDLIVPVKNPYRDWNIVVPFRNTKNNDTTARYIAFGWGDRPFYLETPTWSDLKFSTALKAGLGLDRSAMHVTFYRTILEDKDCIRIDIRNDQYQRLIQYIDSSFELDSAKLPKLIPTNATYGGTDAFYEAKGYYSIFKTCNSWVNTGLKVAGLKAALWAPFDWCIFHQYRK